MHCWPQILARICRRKQRYFERKRENLGSREFAPLQQSPLRIPGILSPLDNSSSITSKNLEAQPKDSHRPMVTQGYVPDEGCTQTASRLLQLPLELRRMIYGFIMGD